jgi:glycosyltransferase involved in cell wall biosynthesis
MDHPMFTIIVPIYNAEENAERLLTRLKQLTYADYEVLLINDGSTDRSKELLEEGIKDDPRFQLITTKNQGPGLARNEGIKRASGKYVLFFDADDYPKKDCLTDYAKILEQDPETDLVISSFIFRTMSGGKLVSEKEYKVTDYRYTENEKFLSDMYELMNKQLMYVVWNKCYKREILEQYDILFKGYSSCEDRIFNVSYYQYCQQVIFNPAIEYVYEFEGGKGVTNQYKENKYDTFKEFYEMTNFITQDQNKEGMASLLLKGTTSVILSILETEKLDRKEKKREILEILSDPAIKEAKKIARTDSKAKMLVKRLYNMPDPVIFTVLKAGSFVEVKMPGVMAVLKRGY